MTKTIKYEWQDVDKAIQTIAMDMYKDTWRPDYIVGITRGGLVPAVMLSHMTSIPMHTLCVQLAAEGLEENTESNTWMPEDASSGKKILIIDDINRGGDALDWIKKDWEKENSLRWPMIWHQNVKFASLIMDPNSIVETDYYYEELDTENEVWIEFPWET